MSTKYLPRGTSLADRIRLLSVPQPDGCWQWQGPIDRGGYGVTNFRRRYLRAHRGAYMAFVGRIPEAMTVDHLCFNTACVNPAHLRLLTNLENARNQRKAFKTECTHGHAFTTANTGWQINRRNPSGPLHRYCIECKRANDRRAKQRRRAAA